MDLKRKLQVLNLELSLLEMESYDTLQGTFLVGAAMGGVIGVLVLLLTNSFSARLGVALILYGVALIRAYFLKEEEDKRRKKEFLNEFLEKIPVHEREEFIKLLRKNRQTKDLV